MIRMPRSDARLERLKDADIDPLGLQGGRNPSRNEGLAHARIGPGDKNPLHKPTSRMQSYTTEVINRISSSVIDSGGIRTMMFPRGRIRRGFLRAARQILC